MGKPRGRAHLGIDTAVTQSPGTAVPLTHRTHNGSIGLADLPAKEGHKDTQEGFPLKVLLSNICYIYIML